MPSQDGSAISSLGVGPSLSDPSGHPWHLPIDLVSDVHFLFSVGHKIKLK